MIIGNGLIAKALLKIDNPDVVFIAAGVSDSSCNDSNHFLREEILVKRILKENKNKLIVYFSTYSIYDLALANSPYVLHKLRIEKLISESEQKYIISRISNVVGVGGNPKNLFNHIFFSIKNNIKFTLWQNCYRNIILVDDAIKILNHIILNEAEHSETRIFNVVNFENTLVEDIVNSIQIHLNKKAIYTTLDVESNSFPVDQISKKRFIEIIGEESNYLSKILNILA
jgi:nucleoside-diphosphate-sugar epimerase